MNKYQEALEIVDCKMHADDWFCEIEKRSSEECAKCDFTKAYETLEELVNKATPQKPYKTEAVGEHYYACPRCGSLIKEEYHVKNILKSPSKDILPNGCSRCLQALDWSEQ